MCRERIIDDRNLDNTVDQENQQLIEKIHDQLNELLLTTINLQEESKRLENEAKNLIYENIQMQIEARLLKDKYYYRRRYSYLRRQKSFNFKQLKKQIKIQRKNFFKFERRLCAKYEQPLYNIISNSTKNLQKEQRQFRRIRSISTESID